MNDTGERNDKQPISNSFPSFSRETKGSTKKTIDAIRYVRSYIVSGFFGDQPEFLRNTMKKYIHNNQHGMRKSQNFMSSSDLFSIFHPFKKARCLPLLYSRICGSSREIF
jgi:hypothetical protein